MKCTKKLAVGILAFAIAVCMLVIATPKKAYAALEEDLVFGKNYTFEKRGEYKYTVTLPESGKVAVKFIADDSSAFSRINIYEENGEAISLSVVGFQDFNGSYGKTLDLKAGKYTFWFHGATGNQNKLASGIMNMTFTSANETYAENAINTNDEMGVASEIVLDESATVNGQFAANDKVDYYTFNVPRKKKLSITFTSALSQVNLQLFNETLDYEYRENNMASGSHKYEVSIPAGTYYLAVTNANTSVTGNYTMTLSAKDELSIGDVFVSNNYKYKVTGTSAVAFAGVDNKRITKITIPKTVKYGDKIYKVNSVAARALYKNQKVTKVTIGANVKTVGADAFTGCTKLKTVSVKKNVEFIIGKYKYKTTDSSALAFAGVNTTSLKKVVIEDTVKIGAKKYKVTSIASKALYYNKKVTSVTIGANIKTIGSSAFNGCKNLSTIKIESKVLKKVESKAFKGISSKAKIKVPAKMLTAYQKILKNKGQGSSVKILKY